MGARGQGAPALAPPDLVVVHGRTPEPGPPRDDHRAAAGPLRRRVPPRRRQRPGGAAPNGCAPVPGAPARLGRDRPNARARMGRTASPGRIRTGRPPHHQLGSRRGGLDPRPARRRASGLSLASVSYADASERSNARAVALGADGSSRRPAGACTGRNRWPIRAAAAALGCRRRRDRRVAVMVRCNVAPHSVTSVPQCFAFAIRHAGRRLRAAETRGNTYAGQVTRPAL